MLSSGLVKRASTVAAIAWEAMVVFMSLPTPYRKTSSSSTRRVIGLGLGIGN